MSKFGIRFSGELKGFTATQKTRRSSNTLVNDILEANLAEGESVLYSRNQFSQGHEYSEKTLDWGVYTLLRATAMIKRGLLFEVKRGVLDENTANQITKSEGVKSVAGDIAFQITRVKMSKEEQKAILDRRQAKIDARARAKEVVA